MTHHLSVFDKTVQETYSLLKLINQNARWGEDNHKALAGLRSVLQVLRDCLPLANSANFSAQLPILVRGLYFENWNYHDQPLRTRHQAEFLALIQQKLPMAPEIDAEIACKAVVQALQAIIDKDVIDNWLSGLTNEIKQIWYNEFTPGE